MKVARLVVLGVAVSAGGLAFTLAGRGTPPPPTQIVRPAQETVDVLVAKAGIGIGRAVAQEDLARRANSVNFVRYGVTSVQSTR